LIVALCTGPVTRPSNSPRRQAAAACASASTTAPALRGSGVPMATGAALRMSTNGSTPGAEATASGAVHSIARPMACAACARVSGSPKATRSASRCRWAARMHSSGPTPAGSPGTSASPGRRISAPGGVGRGVAGADVDVGLAANLAQEAIPFVFQLALADGLAHLRTAVVVGHVGLAGAGALHDVPAGLGLERRRDLAVLQCRDL